MKRCFIGGYSLEDDTILKWADMQDTSLHNISTMVQLLIQIHDIIGSSPSRICGALCQSSLEPIRSSVESRKFSNLFELTRTQTDHCRLNIDIIKLGTH